MVLLRVPLGVCLELFEGVRLEQHLFAFVLEQF